MRYLGGKARLSDEISSVLNQIDSEYYLEPFCGVCWVGQKVEKRVRIFSDINPFLIAMWKAAKEGWIPPKHVNEEEYARVRLDTSDPALHGFVSIAASWGGKVWGGYARGSKSNGEDRNYTLNAHNQLMKRIKYFKDCKFLCCRYTKVFKTLLAFDKPCVVYLDPPYDATTEYAYKFDTIKFWHNVRVISKKHYVITS